MTEKKTVTKFDAKSSERKRKRAQRNKERLTSHQTKILDNFASGINTGYTHENWVGLSKLYTQISSFTAPEEHRALGQLWRESFVSNLSPSYVEKIIGLVKVRLVTGRGTRANKL
jgi:hypothetical protein